MDEVLVELFGKTKIKRAKWITIVAQDFTFTEDRAKFLKATLAIPAKHGLPIHNVPNHLIQLGPIHVEIKEFLDKDGNWLVSQFSDICETICDKLEQVISHEPKILYINEASILEMLINDYRTIKRFMRTLYECVQLKDIFVVIFYQSSKLNAGSKFLRDLTYLSSAMVKTRAFKDHYFQQIWYQPLQTNRTLIPAKIETIYSTCSIDESPLPSFQRYKRVDKFYDPTQNSVIPLDATGNPDSKSLDVLDLTCDDESKEDHSTTLPYVSAQNPEQSKIFYYPDKDDDIDEDDPDNDLNI